MVIKVARRAVLGGVATAPLWATQLLDISRAEAASEIPKRVVWYHFPLGTPRSTFITPGVPKMDFSGSSLAPLQPHSNSLLVVDGVHLRQGSNHSELPALLSGVYNRSDKYGPPANVTIDQYIAQGLANKRVLLFEDANRREGSYLASAAAAGVAALPEGKPLDAFNKYFSGSDASAGPTRSALQLRRRSVLDRVRGDLNAMRTRLGAIEREKLDRHLEAMRTFEVQLTSAGQAAGSNCSSLAPSKPVDIGHDRHEIPVNLRAYVDLMAASMACSVAQVGVIYAPSNGRHFITDGYGEKKYQYWEAENFGFMTHGLKTFHDSFTHDDGGTKGIWLHEHTALVRFHMTIFARLIEKFKAVPEGNGTMYDHSLLVMTSEEGCRYPTDNLKDRYGNARRGKHETRDLPMVLAGGLSGTFKRGAYIDLRDATQADLWVTIMNAMGVQGAQFGSVSGRPLSTLLA
jgi:hypothetical protein